MSGDKSSFVKTTVGDALGLSHEEMYLIDLNIALGQLLKQTRQKKKMSQVKFGKLIGVLQPRLALMESGHPSVSIEAYLTTFFRLGLSNRAGKVIVDASKRAETVA